MSANCTPGPPSEFESGNSVQFTESFPDFPASSWSLTLFLSLSGSMAMQLEGAPSGDSFTFTITPANSAKLSPGSYDFAEYASTDTERKTARTGIIIVLANLALSQPKSSAQISLEAVTAAIQKLSGTTNQEVKFNGQEYAKKDLGKLIEQQTFFQAQVIREQRSQAALRGRPFQSRIPIGFVGPECPSVLRGIEGEYQQ